MWNEHFYFYIATSPEWKIIGVTSIYCKGYIHKGVPCIAQASLHFATKRGSEITELMEVVKSCQDSIYMWSVFFCSQAAWICLILPLHCIWTRVSFSESSRTAPRGDTSPGLQQLGRFCTKLHCSVCGLLSVAPSQFGPGHFSFQEYESNGWVISEEQSAVSNRGIDFSFRSLKVRTGHIFS